MNVLFANRRDSRNQLAGDVIQLQKTRECLEKMYDISISIIYEPQDILTSDSDIVHVFNIQTIDETLAFIDTAKLCNKRVALSPIYWDLFDACVVGTLWKMGLGRYLSVFGHLRKLLNSAYRLKKHIFFANSSSWGGKIYLEKRRRALLEADIILPNSPEEMQILSMEFGIDPEYLKQKSLIVPNATNIDISYCKRTINNNCLDINNFVLCVANIHPVKNQLSIIMAFFEMKEVPIVLVGDIGSTSYYDEILMLSRKRGNVHILGRVNHNDIYEIYRCATVHVLASFRESPGLSTIEALACGCEVVVSCDRHCPNEHYGFNHYAHKCDPYSIASIRNAIFESYHKKKNTITREEMTKYSYERAATMTREAYEMMLSKSG